MIGSFFAASCVVCKANTRKHCSVCSQSICARCSFRRSSVAKSGPKRVCFACKNKDQWRSQIKEAAGCGLVQRVEDIVEQVRREGLSVTEFLNAMVHPLNKPDKTRLADTAMHRACRVGHVPVVRSLMIKRARWDLQGGLNRMTAKEEAGELKRSNPTAHRQLMELMSEPMPPCPHGHRYALPDAYNLPIAGTRVWVAGFGQGTVRQSTRHGIGVEFERPVGNPNSVALFPNGLRFRSRQTLDQKDFWKLFLVQKKGQKTPSGLANPSPKTPRVSFTNATRSEAKAKFHLAFDSQDKFLDVEGRYSNFDPSSDYYLLLPDGQRAAPRQHQIESLQLFQLQEEQHSIFIQKNKVWYRPLSRTASPLRIISPLDDERGTIAQAKQRGDKARVTYLQTCLPAAVLKMDERLIQKLLKFKADVNARIEGRRTPLHIAASLSRLAIVRELVGNKADVHACDAEGRSALHWAAEGNAVESCAFLIGQGAEVNARTWREWTPLHYACRGHVDQETNWSTKRKTSLGIRKADLPMAILLIMNKADINATESETGSEPLEWVHDAGHKLALVATEAVMHVEWERMTHGCSTPYCCRFLEHLSRSLKYCRTAPSLNIAHSPHPISTYEAMEVASVMRKLVEKGADPELLLLSVLDSGAHINEHFAIECIETLKKEHGAKGLVAPSNDPGRTAKMVGEGSVHPKVQLLCRELSRLCGRYQLAGRVEHCTETSVVRLATDLDGSPVAIKFMRGVTHFQLEIESRALLAGDKEGQAVVALRAHTEDGDLDAARFRLEAQHLGYGPHGIVMEAMDRNLAVATLQESFSPAQISDIMRSVVQCVHHLHQHTGRIHGDLTQANIMRTKDLGRWKLIDLDCACKLGQMVPNRASMAYCAPELARHILMPEKAPCPRAHPSLDVWSIGVILFELLSTHALFPRNARSDDIEDIAAQQRLCMWLGPTPAMLQQVQVHTAHDHANQLQKQQDIEKQQRNTSPNRSVSNSLPAITPPPKAKPAFWKQQSVPLESEVCRARRAAFLASVRRHDNADQTSHPVEADDAANSKKDFSGAAVDLVQRCLQGAPEDRPTVDQLLAHPFLRWQRANWTHWGSNSSVKRVRPPKKLEQRTHVFISHFQIEAAGEASRIFKALEDVGATGWLDMYADDLTEVGMRAGVENAEIFLMLLTSNVLSRPYCLKELEWALAANKPIVMLVEEEERFFPWSYEEWKKNKVWDKTGRQWVPAVPTSGAVSNWEELARADGSSVWINSVTGKWQTIDPTKNVVARAGNEHLGSYDKMAAHKDIRDKVEELAQTQMLMPLRRRDFEVKAMVREIVRRGAQHGYTWRLPTVPSTRALAPNMVVRAIWTEAHGDAGRTIMKALRSAAASRKVAWTDLAASATHTIVVLTKGAVTAGSASAKALVRVLQAGRPFIFVFSVAGGWEFYGIERSGAHSLIDAALNANEAMAYRAPVPEQMRYEHDAMVNEMFVRLSKK